MYKDLQKLQNYEVLDYGRLSRKDDDPLLSIDEVLEKHGKIIEEYAIKYLNGPIPEENKYREIGSGESIKSRPEIQKVLKRIEDPRIKAVAVVDVQRLSRGDLEDAGKLIKLFRYTDTYIITPQKTYDLKDEYDRDVFERELKRGNDYLEYFKKIQSRGKLSSVKAGNYVGSVAPYGYNRIQKTELDGKKTYWTLEENIEEADVVRNIFNWYCKERLGVSNICRRLESLNIPNKTGHVKWTAATIYTMLENVHYAGYVRWNWRKEIKVIEDQEVKVLRPMAKDGEYLVFEGRHEGLISKELFESAKNIRGTYPRKVIDKSLKNAFSGLIYCKCGSSLGYNSYVNHGVEFAAPKLKCNNQVRCKTGSVEYKEVLDYVCITLKSAIDDFEIKVKTEQNNSAELHNNLIDVLNIKLNKLKEKEIMQWDAQYDPDPDKRMPPEIFKSLNEKLRKEKEDVEQALKEAYDTMPEPVNYKEKLVMFTEALNALNDDKISVEVKNEYLKKVIKRIEYNRAPSTRMTKDLGKLYDKNQKWYVPPFEMTIELL